MSQLAAFCYEFGILARTPRSGFHFLGSGEQTVAEHTCRALGIAFLLARLSREPVNELRLMKLLLLHYLPEARTSDMNYVHQKYVRVNWDKLLADLQRDLPFGEEIVSLVREFEGRVTLEAELANDADQLELLASLREELDHGNPRGADWIAPVRSRVRSEAGQRLAAEIVDTPSDAWWFGDKADPYWVDRSSAEQ